MFCRSANGRLNDSGRSAWWFYVLMPLSPLNWPIIFSIIRINGLPWDQMDNSTIRWFNTNTLVNHLYQLTSQTLWCFYALSVIVLLFWLFLSPGTRGDNRYGPAPTH